MELAKVTSKGQITIPVSIRRKYGLQEGSKILFLEEDGRVYMTDAASVLQPKKQVDDPRK